MTTRIGRVRRSIRPYDTDAAWAAAIELARTKHDVSGIVHLLSDAMPTDAHKALELLLNEWRPTSKRGVKPRLTAIRLEQIHDSYRNEVARRDYYSRADGKLRRPGDGSRPLRIQDIDQKYAARCHLSVQQFRSLMRVQSRLVSAARASGKPRRGRANSA